MKVLISADMEGTCGVVSWVQVMPPEYGGEAHSQDRYYRTRERMTAEINRQTKLGKDIARAQSDISSGKRLQTASDDPAAWARVSVIKRTLSNQEAWLSNANTAASVADQVSSVLDGLSNSLQRAGELMVAANNASSPASDRASSGAGTCR